MNLLIAALMVYSTFTIVMVLFSYNLGLKNGSQLAKSEEISSIKPEVKSESVDESLETDYERRFRESWENIARFDGTDIGQREVN